MLGLVKPGDLICVEWLDASRGRVNTTREMRSVGASPGVVDSPVKSYGVYIGLFGARSNHIVLVASLWTHSGDFGQIDTTIIPLGIIEKISLIVANVMDVNNLKLCQIAFIEGRCYHFLKRFRVSGRKFAEAR